jgi:hypothetical protein
LISIAQGRTAERVIIHADSSATNLVDQKMMYFGISRTKTSAAVYTDDRAKPIAGINHARCKLIGFADVPNLAVTMSSPPPSVMLPLMMPSFVLMVDDPRPFVTIDPLITTRLTKFKASNGVGKLPAEIAVVAALMMPVALFTTSNELTQAAVVKRACAGRHQNCCRYRTARRDCRRVGDQTAVVYVCVRQGIDGYVRAAINRARIVKRIGARSRNRVTICDVRRFAAKRIGSIAYHGNTPISCIDARS